MRHQMARGIIHGYRSFQRGARLFCGVLCCMALAVIPAAATSLDKDACGQLALERKGLQALKVEELMAKGPDWAVANLSQGDLNLVRRFIEVDEQIKFRCTSPAALVQLRGLTETGDDIGSGDEDADAPAAQPNVPVPPLPARR